MALLRRLITPKLTTLIFPPKLVSTIVPPPSAAFRSFSTSKPFPVIIDFTHQTPDGFYAENNRLQISGPKGEFEAKHMKDGFYVRVDMPGVGKEDVEVFEVEQDSRICWKGTGRKDPARDDEDRVYIGSVQLKAGDGKKIGSIKALMKNGVLRMIIRTVTV